MVEAAHGVETKEEILAALTNAGISMSGPQLARLHRAGAIELAGVRGLGRGRGRESLYRAGATAQAMRLASLAPRERRLPQRAWLDWWLFGGPMSAAASRFLAARAYELDEMLGKVRALGRGETVEIDGRLWTVDEIYAAAEDQRLSGPLARARARTGRKRFSSVMAFLVQLVTGQFRSFPIDELEGSSAPEAQLVEVSFGLGRARKEELGGVGPWLQGGLEDVFSRLAEQLKTLSFQAAAEEPDFLLNIARLEVKTLAEVVAISADCFDAIFGRGAFSYREMADTLDMDDYDAQVFATLAWSRLRRDRSWREGMSEMNAQRGQATAMRQAVITMAALRDAIPTFSELLAPERLAAALRDPESANEFARQLVVLRERMPQEVDAALAQVAATSDSRDGEFGIADLGL
jgi:hypothetical protein